MSASTPHHRTVHAIPSNRSPGGRIALGLAARCARHVADLRKAGILQDREMSPIPFVPLESQGQGVDSWTLSLVFRPARLTLLL